MLHALRRVPMGRVASVMSHHIGRSSETMFGVSVERMMAHRGFLSSTGRKATAFGSGHASPTATEEKHPKDYDWVSPEAQILIARAYNRHKALADTGQSYPPSLSVQDLEHALGTPVHYKPRDFVDRFANRVMRFLSIFTHAFFRKVTKPTLLERGLVMFVQGAYVVFYMGLYLCTPRGAHRLVGYLEEEAHNAYTDYLRAIDEGALPNRPAPELAKQYYRLPDTATIRDVVLHVRADECMHRDFNHMLSDKYRRKELNTHPAFMKADYRGDIESDREEHFDPHRERPETDPK